MREAFICDGIRTPIGRYGGALSGVRADDLAAIPLRELLVRNPRLDAECIDDVILGCANQAGEDNRNVARMATLLAGLPQSVSGTTINRLCGSGLDALGFAARAIKAGDGDLLIAGGVESMSRAPFVMGKATSAFSRQAEMFDTTIGWRFVNPLMAQQFGTDSMPETAENVAELLKISRECGVVINSGLSPSSQYKPVGLDWCGMWEISPILDRFEENAQKCFFLRFFLGEFAQIMQQT